MEQKANEKKSNKTESSRLNLFYIIQVLKKYSDKEHPLSVSKIREKINLDFGYLSSADSIISTDTIKRTLEELIDKIFSAESYFMDNTYYHGYWIFCVMKNKDTYMPYRITEGELPPKKYYYYDSDLTEAEILTLKDAMETYSYFSEEDITDIVSKLIRLQPTSFPKRKYYDIAREQRDENSLLLMNIDELNEIIQRRNDAMIVYGTYDRNKKLQPRKGYPKCIKPLQLLWSNGYYYLLAYNEKYQDISHYRIDRILDIEEVQTEHSNYRNKINPVLYRQEHPIMYSGKKETMVLLCRDTGENHIMNTIMDTFGRNVKVTIANQELVEQYISHSVEDEKNNVTWLRVIVETAIRGAELWAVQYCKDCMIISPEESAQNVKVYLKQGLEFYKN